jgi:hypothetical protein
MRYAVKILLGLLLIFACPDGDAQVISLPDISPAPVLPLQAAGLPTLDSLPQFFDGLPGLRSAAEDEFPLPANARELAAAPVPQAPQAAEVRPSLEHYGKMFVSLKHYLRGRKYFTALKALAFARQYHVGKRKDGVTPEFQHQLAIALYVTTLKDVIDEEKAITAALLHDVMEDYDVGYEEIEARFGSEMAKIVWLLTKEHRGVKKDPKLYFDEIADNPIASLVKGADRIHNVQSMVGVFSIEKQKEYIDEVELYFLPMLKRAGANFPEQTAAYYNIQHMLKSQLELLKAHLRALKGPNRP